MLCERVFVSLSVFMCLSLTGHTVAKVTALALLVEVVSVGVAAAVSEAGALPVDWVVVPTGKTCPTRPSVRGLRAAGCMGTGLWLALS